MPKHSVTPTKHDGAEKVNLAGAASDSAYPHEAHFETFCPPEGGVRPERAAQGSNIRLQLDRSSGDAEWRIAAWQEVMSGSGRVEVRPEDRDDFTGRFQSRAIGDLMTLRVTASDFRLIRDADMAARIETDYALINLIEQGHVTGSANGRRFEVEPGAVCITRLTSLMDVAILGADWLALLVPLAALESCKAWRETLNGRVFAPDSVPAVLLGHHLRSMLALPEPLAGRRAEQIARTSLGFVASCLGGGPPPLRPAQREDKGLRVRQYITEHLGDPALDPAAICREFALSRSQLYRLMGSQMNIAAIIRQQRLQGAHEDIAQTVGTIDEIAQRWGIPNLRSFRRAFVREFGYSPSELRARHRPQPGQPKPVPKLGSVLNRWMQGQ